VNHFIGEQSYISKAAVEVLLENNVCKIRNIASFHFRCHG